MAYGLWAVILLESWPGCWWKYFWFQASKWRWLCSDEGVYLSFGCHPKFAHMFKPVSGSSSFFPAV